MPTFETRCRPKEGGTLINDDKRWRTFMTTSGLKTFRVQPMIDNSSLAKYQKRSDWHQEPLAHSTPEPPCNDQRMCLRTRPNSCPVNKLASTKSAEGFAKTTPIVSCSLPPSPVPCCSSSTGRHHTKTFTVRCQSCIPPHLYMSEPLRTAAKLNRPSSHLSARQDRCGNRTETKDEEVVSSRFGQIITLPSFVKTNPHLKHNDLTMGQKQYLWGIARIYSVSRLKEQKQLQYQALLDQELKRKLESKGLKEREKVKMMKEYLRYTRFIKTYEQRIPRNLRASDSVNEVRVADHIHRHMIKGWTTDANAFSKYGVVCDNDNEEPGDKIESQERCKEKVERGAHIYKHVIKGWTMDPKANEAFDFEECSYKEKQKNHELSLAELDKALHDGVSVYR